MYRNVFPLLLYDVAEKSEKFSESLDAPTHSLCCRNRLFNNFIIYVPNNNNDKKLILYNRHPQQEKLLCWTWYKKLKNYYEVINNKSQIQLYTFYILVESCFYQCTIGLPDVRNFRVFYIAEINRKRIVINIHLEKGTYIIWKTFSSFGVKSNL